LNLTQTISHDWHVQPFVKDPREIRTGRPLRIVTAHNLTVLSVVLETFQTYYARFRAVNLRTSIINREHRARRLRQANAQYAALRVFGLKILRAKGRERLNSLKILFWRFRDSANLSKNSVPDFQPRGRGSYFRLSHLRCPLLLQDSKSFPHPQATGMPLADLFFIPDIPGGRKPVPATFVT
jgi:hypothetical protein